MLFKKESEFAAHLKNEQPERVYLIYSQDPGLTVLWKNKLIEKILGKNAAADFNLHKFEGSRLDMQLLADAVDALPVMAPSKAVVVEDLDFCSLAKNDADALLELMKDIPQETTLILAAAAGFGQSYEKKVKDKENKLIREADKLGCAAGLMRRTEMENRAMLQKLAQKQGCAIDDKAVKYLLQSCNDDLTSLKNEMEKLTAYLGGQGVITLEIVQLLTPKAIEARVFDLAKAVLSGRYEQAVQILDDLLYLKNKPTVILSNLTSAYLDLYRCKLASGRGKTAADVIKDFGYPANQAFRVNNSFSDCRKYSVARLRESICILAEADYQLKSSRMEDEIILQKVITDLFVQKN